MPCLTPYRGDTSQMLLFKIASCLEANGGGGVTSFNGLSGAVTGVTSFNGRDGVVILTLGDVAAVADGRYVLKAGDTMTGALAMPAGSAALPSNTFSGDTNTGMYSPGADLVGFSTGGTLRLTVSSTAITPTVPILAPDGTTALPAFSFSSDPNTGIYRIGADNMGFSTGGLERVQIDSAGRVGIGTVPGFALDILNATLPQIRLSNTSVDATAKFGYASVRHYTNAEEPITIFAAIGMPASNEVYVGGSSGSMNAATDIFFFTAVNSTTTSGSERVKINSTDLLLRPGIRLAMLAGANQRAGDAVLVAGTVTVANTTVTANTRVFVSRKTNGGVPGTSFTYTLIAATSFTITSSNVADTSTVSYLLIEVP